LRRHRRVAGLPLAPSLKCNSSLIVPDGVFVKWVCDEADGGWLHYSSDVGGSILPATPASGTGCHTYHFLIQEKTADGLATPQGQDASVALTECGVRGLPFFPVSCGWCQNHRGTSVVAEARFEFLAASPPAPCKSC